MDHPHFMNEAVKEAKLGLEEGGIPIGSVLVRDNEIIGRGHNRRMQLAKPMHHAEIDCLDNAGPQASYEDTVLYSTLMPCMLCSGAVLQFGIKQVVVGDSRNFPGGVVKTTSSPELLRENGVQLVNMNDATCIKMMKTFIKENPAIWNGDIGK